MDAREDEMGATWLAGRYQVAGLRARGALCLVYQGQDAVLQRPVAIKAPLAEHADVYRSTLELTSALAHPAFLALYDTIEQGHGLFLAYEYVDGRPLADYLTSGLPLRRALALMTQVARALAYAHAHGVTHGDLTPSAILVDRAARARVTNVGMPPDSVYFDDTAASAHASGVADSPDSTAELLAEDTARLDTWAVAALLWQLVTDESATTGEPARVRSYRADMPDDLRRMIARALSVSHASAITTVESLEAELTALDATLASAVEGAEAIPSTIVALREAQERAENGPPGVAGEARWHGMSARGVSPTATTSLGDLGGEEPYGFDASVMQPSEDVEFQAQVPRLHLPLRPLTRTDPRSLNLAHAIPEAPLRWQTTASASAGATERLGLSGWIWALIVIAVFAICFLVGFLVTPVLPIPHLP